MQQVEQNLGGGCRGCAPPPPSPGFLIQLVFCKKTMWFIGVEVEQETSALPPKKNPGSAPVPNLLLSASQEPGPGPKVILVMRMGRS